jgi:hypothetical protein
VVASGVGGGFVPDSECSAGADPTLVLDQSAFDTAMGADTYALSGYWSLQASPNLNDGSAVPEPANLFLVGLGLAAMGWRAATLKPRRIR